MISIVDPLSISTLGLLSSEPIADGTLSIATDGFIVFLEEEIIQVPVSTTLPIPSAGAGRRRYRKRITARVVVMGTTYTQYVDVDDLSLSLTDVKVVVDHHASKPTIQIILPDTV